jgi:hypothetical protein
LQNFALAANLGEQRAGIEFPPPCSRGVLLSIFLEKFLGFWKLMPTSELVELRVEKTASRDRAG